MLLLLADKSPYEKRQGGRKKSQFQNVNALAA